jgi:hypothetical protein
MKVNERFLAMNLCILMLSLLFVFSEKMGAAEISDTEPTDVYQESVSGGEPEDSRAWADKSEEGYGEEPPYEEEYSEEAEEEGRKYETDPSDPEYESAPQWPSDDESLPPTRYSDDDMAQGSIEE